VVNQSFWPLSFLTSKRICAEGLQGPHAFNMLGRTLQPDVTQLIESCQLWWGCTAGRVYSLMRRINFVKRKAIAESKHCIADFA
jgi:hypothetical protein